MDYPYSDDEYSDDEYSDDGFSDSDDESIISGSSSCGSNRTVSVSELGMRLNRTSPPAAGDVYMPDALPSPLSSGEREGRWPHLSSISRTTTEVQEVLRFDSLGSERSEPLADDSALVASPRPEGPQVHRSGRIYFRHDDGGAAIDKVRAKETLSNGVQERDNRIGSWVMEVDEDIEPTQLASSHIFNTLLSRKPKASKILQPAFLDEVPRQRSEVQVEPATFLRDSNADADHDASSKPKAFGGLVMQRSVPIASTSGDRKTVIPRASSAPPRDPDGILMTSQEHNSAHTFEHVTSHTSTMNDAEYRGPPLYDPTKVSRSVIYWPQNEPSIDRGSTAETKDTPRPSAGIKTFLENLPDGGSIVSVHQPTASLAWVEENYDTHLVYSVRYEFSGPLAMMLFPDTPALAIFGPHSDKQLVKLARELANESNFPVVVRPAADNPISRLNALNTDVVDKGRVDVPRKLREIFNRRSAIAAAQKYGLPTCEDEEERHENEGDPLTTTQLRGIGRGSRVTLSPSQGGDTVGGARDGDPSESPIPTIPEGNEHPEDNADDIGDGADSGDDGTGGNSAHKDYQDGTGDIDGHGSGGDGGGDDPGGVEVEDRWEGPLHQTKCVIGVRANPNHPVRITLDFATQFTTHEKACLRRRFTDQKFNAEIITGLNISHNAGQVLVERSYASLGLLAHRELSMYSCKTLDRGFNMPPQVHKHSRVNTNGHDFTAGLALSGPPVPTLEYKYSRTATDMFEATDTKPMPRCKVSVDVGEGWDESEDGTAYESFVYAYKPRPDFRPAEDREQQAVNAEFGMGVNFFPYDMNDPNDSDPIPFPKATYVNRNQICLFVRDPALKTEGLIMNIFYDHIIADIRTKVPEWNVIVGDMDARRGRAVTKATPEGAISLGVAGKRVPTKPDADGAKKHTGRRTKKMLRGLKLMRPSPPPLTFVATELASRGWDVTNRQWREPLYPQLDQYFLPIVDPADESVSTVWRIQPPSLRHRGKCV
ncbi:hypothetical protein C8J57DRAFT_1282345 [Mycena rebaudengoi]|nr:hypothetical protein C8J57DRAFT_1282345 [Mycena rebaudengoi]